MKGWGSNFQPFICLSLRCPCILHQLFSCTINSENSQKKIGLPLDKKPFAYYNPASLQAKMIVL